MQATTTHALKEWATAVDALERGKTIMLLRKGGIREQSGRFSVEYNQVWLYPTCEHQQPDLLKPEYASQVTPVSSGWHPEKIRIGSWAEITDILMVSDSSVVGALLPFHVWNEKFVSDRLKWKARQPLYVLLLRTYQLPKAQEIPYLPQYEGCRSWIDLAASLDIAGSVPVLNNSAYSHLVTEIRRIVGNSENVCCSY